MNKLKSTTEHLTEKKPLRPAELAQKTYDMIKPDQDYDVQELLQMFENDYNTKYPGFFRDLSPDDIELLEKYKSTIESFEDNIDTAFIALKLQEERDQILDTYFEKDRKKAEQKLDFMGEFILCTLVTAEKKKRQIPLFYKG